MYIKYFSRARERQDDDQKNKIKNQLTKGAMLHIKGFSKETKREDIKNFLQDYGQIAWVDFNSGDTEVELFFKALKSIPSITH